MADTNVALQSALITWWEGHRPLGWVEEDHVAKPLVNCQTDEEQALALIAADIARCGLASRPAEVDDEGLPALPESAKLTIYELQREPYFTAEQYRQGQRDAVAADRARRSADHQAEMAQWARENGLNVPESWAAPSHTTNKEK